MINDDDEHENSFLRSCFSFYYFKTALFKKKLSYLCLPSSPSDFAVPKNPIALRNSTNQKSRHVLGTDQYIAPEAYEGPLLLVFLGGECVFFSKTAWEKGREMVLDFLFRMFVNLARPLFSPNFLETSAKRWFKGFPPTFAKLWKFLVVW